MRAGERIKRRRKEKGFSYRRLAKEVGCSHPHLADIESGRRKPSEELMIRLSVVLDLPLDEMGRGADRIDVIIDQVTKTRRDMEAAKKDIAEIGETLKCLRK